MIAIRKITTPPVRVGDATLVLTALRISVRLPHGLGGAVWATPVGVELRSREGTMRSSPIWDPTGVAQCALFGTALAGVVVSRFISRTRQSRKRSGGGRWR